MPSHHLRGNRLRYFGGIEAGLLGSNLGVHRDLEQKVPQLLHDLAVVASIDSFEELVRLF